MDWIAFVLIVVVIAAVVAAGAAYVLSQRRTRLRERFGPEYERVVTDGRDRREAESELRARLDAHDQLSIRALSPEERDAYGEEWRQVQADFVDRPDDSLNAADALVGRLMRDVGYPVDDFDQQADLVSVDHPKVVAHYREAHGVFVRAGDEEVSTEDLRQALVSYRALFAELLDDRATDDRAAHRTEDDDGETVDEKETAR